MTMSERIEELAAEVAREAISGGSCGSPQLSQLAQAHLELRRALASMRAAEALAKKSEVRL